MHLHEIRSGKSINNAHAVDTSQVALYSCSKQFLNLIKNENCWSISETLHVNLLEEGQEIPTMKS